MPFSNGSARLPLFLSLFTFAPPQGLVFLLVSFLFCLHSKFVLREFYLGFVGSHSRGFADEAFRLVETHSRCGVLHVFRRTVFRGQPIFIEQTPGLMARLGDAFKLHIIDSVLDCCNVVYVGYSPLCCVVSLLPPVPSCHLRSLFSLCSIKGMYSRLQPIETGRFGLRTHAPVRHLVFQPSVSYMSTT